jgi:hypothetical protein
MVKDASRDRTVFRLVRRLGVATLAAIVVLPALVCVMDWATAVRTANAQATGAAFVLTGTRFVGRSWEPTRLDRRIVAATAQHPPKSDPYAGYAHATHVEIVMEWKPRLSALIGGPYLVRGRATAAILQNREGKWAPQVVR